MEDAAEFDKEETIDGIESALRELGYATDRIGHARSLVKRLEAGDRQPPQDLAAEQSVLGGMLLSKDSIADVVALVRPLEG